MKTLQSLWILVSGILIALMGVLHCVAIPGMYTEIYDFLSKAGMAEETLASALSLTYFFALSGVLVVSNGLLMIYASFGLRKLEGWARVIASTSAWLMTFMGIGAMSYGMSTPPIWIVAGAAITSAVVLLIGLFVLRQPEPALAG